MTRDEIFEHLKGVLVELFELNPNDIGLGAKDYDPEKAHRWTHDCIFWLNQRGFVK